MGLETRTAHCACGRLQVAVAGEPYFVAACSCMQCQRRTGSAFGVSSYFTGEQLVSAAGESTIFIRSSDSGRSVQFHFCPHCGSTVYWTGVGESIAEGLGIAAGCFADPEFPAPQIVAWCVSQLGWVAFPADIPHHDTQPDSVPGVY
jgi:hypothetical protein